MNHRQAKKYYKSWTVKRNYIYYDWTIEMDMASELTWGKLKKIGLVPAPKRWRQRAKAQKALDNLMLLAKET